MTCAVRYCTNNKEPGHQVCPWHAETTVALLDALDKAPETIMFDVRCVMCGLVGARRWTHTEMRGAMAIGMRCGRCRSTMIEVEKAA